MTHHYKDFALLVTGVTNGILGSEIASIGVPATADGRDDFWVTVGWGHYGIGDAVMPGQGRVEERATLGRAITTLGESTVDVYLNERAYWHNVPVSVWNYKLGRSLLPEEVKHFTDTARRIGGILIVNEVE